MQFVRTKQLFAACPEAARLFPVGRRRKHSLSLRFAGFVIEISQGLLLVFLMSEEQRRAGLLLRTAAKAIDFILIAAVAEIIPRAGFFAGLAYLLLGDGFFDGRSIGKKLIRIRVVSAATGTPCTFRDSILRNSTFAAAYLFWIVPWIGWIFFVVVAAVEFVLVLGSKDGMRLGDEIAKTTVLEN
jgi:hypothetical protein